MAVGSLLRLSAVGVAVAVLAGALSAGTAGANPPQKAGAVEEQPAPAPQPAVEPAAKPAETRDAENADLAAREHLSSGLIGGKHDFTRNGASGRDLCLPCHTPHLVAEPTPRLDDRPDTMQPLQPYQDANIELTGWSLLCLGCHDGVTAPDVYSSAHAVAVTDQLADSRLATVGLRSHPVGVKYPVASEDYRSLAAVEEAGLLLPDGRIQCTTCHDAHNTHRHPGMLRISNERSRVCLTCHRR